ncbi:MAG: ABC transporter ATP-binding protein [Fimbriimonadaceae bacterium]|nr:ABC transporter ATP-binding protein [Fimbriimonadaceae bacterium]
MVEIVNLAVSRGRSAILEDINLTVKAGERVALVGPNGAGKSTLLAAAGGLLPIASGRVTVCGEDFSRLTPRSRARLVAWVPQDEPRLFAHRIRDLVGMGRLGLSPGLRESPEDQDAVEAALNAFDLSHLAERSIQAVSGGEHRLAMLARAAAQDSRVLLLDEPTTGLDPAHHGLVSDAVRRLSEAGKAVLLTTHDLNWALHGADRLVAIRQGRIIGETEPAGARSLLEEVFSCRLEWGVLGSRPWCLLPDSAR